MKSTKNCQLFIISLEKMMLSPIFSTRYFFIDLIFLILDDIGRFGLGTVMSVKRQHPIPIYISSYMRMEKKQNL